MPELPEVESVAAALRRHLAGRRLTGLRVRFPGVLDDPPALVRRRLLGRRLEGVRRHGKYLLLDFEGGACWMLHLRMTGQVLLGGSLRADGHVHLQMDFDGLPILYRDIRKFGRFRLVESGALPRELDHVGPDMLEVDFRRWRERIAGRRAPVKALLLDQGIAAGLGNIYADEALFRAGIHPRTAPADLSDESLRALLREAKGVLRLAIRHGGTTFLNFADFHGRPGNFRRKLRVYGREGEACRRCGGIIAREVIAGRSSFHCPRCQAPVRG